MISNSILTLLPAFKSVATLGSFTASAAKLGVSPSALSQSIRRLETLLDIRLFERSSRNVRLTEAGRALLDATQAPLEALSEAISKTSDDPGRPRGHLRITMSRLALEICMEEKLAGFIRSYPEIVLEISTDDRLTDIVKDGFDAGIRMTDMLQMDMVARPIGPLLRRSLLAAPDYLQRHGVPCEPADLFGHKVIRYRFPSSERLDPIRLKKDKVALEIDPPAAMLLDDNRTIGRAVRAGLGIAQRYRVTEERSLREGALVEIMTDFEPDPTRFHVYYPSRKRASKLTAFLDWFC